MLATTPKTPYYAVIFTSVRTEVDENYTEMAIQMFELAKQQPGFLGYESVREVIGITISYWENMEAIKNWKQISEHLVAQQLGREKWYSQYKIRICLVERDYEFKM
jgi:heme-degrading monooxygenase HmoA